MKQLIFIMEACFIPFEVGTEYLDIIKTGFGFKGLISIR
jgi:hypothetical protein